VKPIRVYYWATPGPAVEVAGVWGESRGEVLIHKTVIATMDTSAVNPLPTFGTLLWKYYKLGPETVTPPPLMFQEGRIKSVLIDRRETADWVIWTLLVLNPRWTSRPREVVYCSTLNQDHGWEEESLEKGRVAATASDAIFKFKDRWWNNQTGLANGLGLNRTEVEWLFKMTTRIGV
jgi:hypothetical protein